MSASSAKTAIAALALLAGAGCYSRPPRIPYIPPDLANWPGTHRSPNGLRLHVFASTGKVRPPRALIGGSGLERIAVDVPAFLIEHPRAGLIVVGTGLDPRLRENPAARLGWLLGAVVGEVTIGDKQDLSSQLADAGFAPEKVKRVILLDGRFPQTGGLADFRSADVVVARAERNWIRTAGSTSGVVDSDFLTVDRWEPVDFVDAEPLGTFPHARDLLEDGSIMLLDVPGYTPGTMAVLVRLRSGPVVIGGPAAPFQHTLRMPAIPAVATDREAWWLSAWRLKRFRELADGLVVIPGFDVAALDVGERRDLLVHDAATTADEGDDDDEKNALGRRPEPSPAFPVADPPSTPPPMGQ